MGHTRPARTIILPFEDELIGVQAGPAGEPWFVGRHICAALGVHRRELSRLADSTKRHGHTPTPGGKQRCILVSEAGLYFLVMRHGANGARAFCCWIDDTVLPAIRKASGASTQVHNLLTLVADSGERFGTADARTERNYRAQIAPTSDGDRGYWTVEEMAAATGVTPNEIECIITALGFRGDPESCEVDTRADRPAGKKAWPRLAIVRSADESPEPSRDSTDDGPDDAA